MFGEISASSAIVLFPKYDMFHFFGKMSLPRFQETKNGCLPAGPSSWSGSWGSQASCPQIHKNCSSFLCLFQALVKRYFVSEVFCHRFSDPTFSSVCPNKNRSSQLPHRGLPTATTEALAFVLVSGSTGSKNLGPPCEVASQVTQPQIFQQKLPWR